MKELTLFLAGVKKRQTSELYTIKLAKAPVENFKVSKKGHVLNGKTFINQGDLVAYSACSAEEAEDFSKASNTGIRVLVDPDSYDPTGLNKCTVIGLAE